MGDKISILNLEIPFDSYVPLRPTIWLTAVKQASLSFFQRNKDPRAYIGNFWYFVEVWWNVWILTSRSYFFRFRPQGPAIGSKVTKNGIFETFCLKAFSVEKLEMPFLEYKSLNVSRRVSRNCFSNFYHIGCQSWENCAKMTILRIKVIIRKFKCHQKIPWVCFAGNDISNYGLIFNTYSAREQIIILMKNFNFF